MYVEIPNNPHGIKVGRCLRTRDFSFLVISTYYTHPLPLWTNWWLHLLVIAATGETAAARKFVQTTRGGMCVVLCGGSKICGIFLNRNWENSADCSTNAALAPCPTTAFYVGEGILGWRCAGESSFTNLLSFEIPAAILWASRPRSHPIFISNQIFRVSSTMLAYNLCNFPVTMHEHVCVLLTQSSKIARPVITFDLDIHPDIDSNP